MRESQGSYSVKDRSRGIYIGVGLGAPDREDDDRRRSSPGFVDA